MMGLQNEVRRAALVAVRGVILVLPPAVSTRFHNAWYCRNDPAHRRGVSCVRHETVALSPGSVEPAG